MRRDPRPLRGPYQPSYDSAGRGFSSTGSDQSGKDGRADDGASGTNNSGQPDHQIWTKGEHGAPSFQQLDQMRTQGRQPQVKPLAPPPSRSSMLHRSKY
jgi:hypothetical protein